MTTQLQPEVRVVYQRPAPPKSAPARVRAIYEYGCHMLRELFGGRRVRPRTEAQAVEVMEAYKHTHDERMVRHQTVLTVDQMEIERGAPVDSDGNEQWGAAIDRLTEFEKKTRQQFAQEEK
jgi:hypothetical protein